MLVFGIPFITGYLLGEAYSPLADIMYPVGGAHPADLHRVRLMLSRAWHRIRQFFGALRPRVRDDERAEAYRWLSPAEQALFETMTLRDQQHGIVVLAAGARESPGDDRDLLAAALLHDCGKGDVASLAPGRACGHACAVRLAPLSASRLEDGPAWRRALWRLRYHPDIGADMARQAGSSPEVGAPDPRAGCRRSRTRGWPLLQAADDA